MASIRIELGIVLYRLGRHGEARQPWQTALAGLEHASQSGIDTPKLRHGIQRAEEFLTRHGPGRDDWDTPPLPPSPGHSYPDQPARRPPEF